ncbi:peroxidase 51-like isoform X1 [Carex littledalei]|uniref:Peroxidase n=1 Tax=Carex littledalei TaxID=544730 RepID=A0A833VIA3_9POAL|nr:peroxidase 51-like isoform X1 [Carex littledalei]
METRRRSNLITILALIALSTVAIGEALTPQYYWQSCPSVQEIVRDQVQKKIKETVVTIPATLRLFFHDSFVTGSDASVLIASPNNDAEKDASDNLSLAGDGFDTVIRAKKAVEAACPGVVSCADILTMATRDVISLSGGPNYTVELGRYDGMISKASLVDGNLPSPDFNVDDLDSMFGKHNLDMTDMIALSGAHTVGFSHCSRFANRLYNNDGQSGQVDPTLDVKYASQLQEACPTNVVPTIAVNMDPFTPITFDNVYFTNLVNGFGLFSSDQVLYTDTRSRPIVQQFAANQSAFFDAFVTAIQKLGALDVKTSADGQIRRDCTKFN